MAPLPPSPAAQGRNARARTRHHPNTILSSSKVFIVHKFSEIEVLVGKPLAVCQFAGIALINAGTELKSDGETHMYQQEETRLQASATGPICLGDSYSEQSDCLSPQNIER